MCLKFKRTAKSMPLASFLPYKYDKTLCSSKNHTLTSQAIKIDHSNIPNINPLYWKCMWSIIRNPGWRNKDAERIRWREGSTETRMNLPQELALHRYEWIENHLSSAAPRTSSEIMTVRRWYAMTVHASYCRFWRSTILGSMNEAGMDIKLSKYAKNGG